MRTALHKISMVLALAVFGVFGAFAQNSLPAPGSGGGFTPNVGSGPGGPGPVFGPGPGFGPAPGPYWDSPWYNSWNSPTIVVNQAPTPPSQGTEKVVACGYDATGVWRVIPLVVSFQYTGAQYSVNVLDAWNPWTRTWDKGVDEPAYNTDYWLRDVEYGYYTVLPTGTFYFNL